MSYSKVTLLTSLEVRVQYTVCICTCIYSMYVCTVRTCTPTSHTHTHTLTLAPTHTQSGSVELTMDREGGYYTSDTVLVSSGTYEGQLVVGDSFINPVKNFTIGTEVDQIVLLEFKVGPSSTKSEHFDPHAAGKVSGCRCIYCMYVHSTSQNVVCILYSS